MRQGLNILPPEPPQDWRDPVIEAYKEGIDRTMLEELAKLTVDQRLRHLQSFVRDTVELRRAAVKAGL